MLEYKGLNSYQQARYIFQWLNAILALIGIISNIFGISMFLRSSMRKYSYSFYCVVMEMSDIVILLHLFRHWSAYVLQTDLDTVAPFFCTMDTYTENIATTFSLWMLTVISFDRLLTVVYPTRFQVIKKRWFQVIIVSVLLVYSIAVNLPFVIGFKIIMYYIAPSVAIPYCYLPTSLNITASIILAVNYMVTIIVVNNVINVKMVWFIVSSRRRLAQSLGVAQVHQKSSFINKDRKFAICSIGLNLTCMILKLPLIVSLLMSTSLVASMTLDQMSLFFTAVGFFYSVDNAVSFYINLFANSMFYEELLVILRLKKDSAQSKVTNSHIGTK